LRAVQSFWRSRRGHSGLLIDATASPVEQLDLEQLLEEIARLTAANRESRATEAEIRLLRLRNAAGVRLLEQADCGAEHPSAEGLEPLGDGPLLEVGPEKLDASLLRAGILRYGCVLVRGLVPRAAAARFAGHIDRSYDERGRHDAGRRHNRGYYTEFEPLAGRGEHMARNWIKAGGGVLAADSPALSFELFELLHDAGLPELVNRYLGEPALIGGQKTTLRRAEPDVPGAWHQDGAFMGPVRALNLWVALSRCGDEAPGLDLVPRRLDSYVQTETDEAMFDHMISQRQAEAAAADTPIVRPVFEPGDALLFDELFLHKTGSDPAMSKPRYAIENWFFGASAFPADYAPLAV
jgi:hypothetical protein